MKMNRKALYREASDYVMIMVAMVSYCIGWTMFLLPNQIGTGGLPGISSILFWAFGIPVQYTFFIINSILMVFAFKTIGLKFCIKTLFGIIFLSLLLPVVQDMTKDIHLLADEPFLAAIIGASFCGVGVGIGLAANGSTGGSDIVAAIVNKYYDVSLGRIILLVDVSIITSCCLVPGYNKEMVIYGYVVLIVASFCVDHVVNSRRRSVQFFIISEKYKEIGEAINNVSHRGCTVVNGQGFYSGHDVKMLFVLVRGREAGTVFSLINEIDPKAFVTQSAVIGVYGEGFDRFKVHGSKNKYKKNEQITNGNGK